jgi:hypothetical protein
LQEERTFLRFLGFTTNKKKRRKGQRKNIDKTAAERKEKKRTQYRDHRA